MKLVYSICIVFLCMLFLAGNVAAADWDNSLSYSNDDLKIELKNWFGLGTNYGSAELKSHPRVDYVKPVHIGEQVVMYYDFNFDEIYTNGLGNVQFIDKNTSQEIQRDYSFVYWEEQEINRPLYDCPSNSKQVNKDCTLLSTEKVLEGSWKPYNSRDIPKGDIRIGILTEVKWGDHIDGIWEIGGKKVSRHADWSNLDFTGYDNWEIFNTTGYDTFSVPVGVENVSVLVLGGGGGGASAAFAVGGAGGGGAGGFIFNNSYSVTPLDVIDIWVGTGGAGGSSGSSNQGFNGTNSTFGNSIAYGGGGGGDGDDGGNNGRGDDGASGGGQGSKGGGQGGGGSAVYGSQGNNGGGGTATPRTSGGGGGHNTTGADGSGTVSGDGGDGTLAFGLYWAAGGGGGGEDGQTTAGGSGGLGGGGDGSQNSAGSDAEASTGSGGGGAGIAGSGSAEGGDGANGVVIVAWNNPTNINVSLISPINTANLSTNPVAFSINVSDSETDGIANVTIQIFNSSGLAYSETNSSHIEGIYNFATSLADGNYEWNVTAYDNSSIDESSNTRSFNLDATNPSITINYPENTTYTTDFTTVNNLDIVINATQTDNNLDSCWIQYTNGTNQTITCNTNKTVNNQPFQTNTYKIWANDTFGNYNSASRSATFAYNVLQNEQGFQSPVIEQTNQFFYLDINIGSPKTISTAYHWYNNTAKATGINSLGGGRYNLTVTRSTPDVSANTNISFFWEIVLSDSSDINTTATNQTVSFLALDDCSSYSTLVLNYTIYDEDTRAFLDNSTINTSSDLTVKISGDFSGDNFNTYSTSTSKNYIPICTNNLISGTNYRLDGTIQYTADSYVTEFNHLENFTINSTYAPLERPLYLLATTRSQEFLITFKDTNFVPVEGALIDIEREYLDINDFLSVEVLKTDKDGRAVGHFVINEEVYTIIITKNGVELDRYEGVQAFCTDILTGNCQIVLNQGGETSNPENFDSNLGVIGAQTYDDSNKEYTFQFTTNDGETKTINLTLLKYDSFLNETICSQQVTSSSGSLICSIDPAYNNGSAVAYITVNGQSWGSGIFEVTVSKAALLNSSRYLLAFFLILMLPLLGITSGPATLLLFIVGLIAAGGLALLDWGGFVGATSAFLWIVIAALVLLWKSTRREE